MSTAAKFRPVEAQYPDEFYRSFNHITGRGVPICSEWSTRDGHVAFYIPEKRWAIELLRNHNRIDEHLSQFKEGGKSHPWLKDKAIDDWIVINCTSTTSSSQGMYVSPFPSTNPAHISIEYPEPRLWTAVFGKDYSELKIFDHQKRPLLDVCLQT